MERAKYLSVDGSAPVNSVRRRLRPPVSVGWALCPAGHAPVVRSPINETKQPADCRGMGLTRWVTGPWLHWRHLCTNSASGRTEPPRWPRMSATNPRTRTPLWNLAQFDTFVGSGDLWKCVHPEAWTMDQLKWARLLEVGSKACGVGSRPEHRKVEHDRLVTRPISPRC